MNECEKINSIDKRYGISGLVAAPIGYLVLLFLPVFLEVASRELSLTGKQIGILGASDSAGLVLATLLCSLFITRLNFHTAAFVGIFISVIGNYASAGVDDFTNLCLIRLITGFGEGLLVAVGISAVGMTSKPGRWFGFYTASIVAVQALGLLVVVPIFNMWNLSGVFMMISGIYLIPLLIIRKLPKKSVIITTNVSKQPTNLLALAMLATLFFYTCIGGVWAYVSFMGTETGLTLKYVSMSLAMAMGAGFIGALFFAFIGKHAKRHSLFAFSTLVMIICLWRLNSFENGFSYIIIVSIYSFFWSIIGARLFALVSDTDNSGRFISAAQTVVGIGFALGPYIASLLISDYGYAGINIMGAISLLLCFLATTPLILFSSRSTENS